MDIPEGLFLHKKHKKSPPDYHMYARESIFLLYIEHISGLPSFLPYAPAFPRYWQQRKPFDRLSPIRAGLLPVLYIYVRYVFSSMKKQALYHVQNLLHRVFPYHLRQQPLTGPVHFPVKQGRRDCSGMWRARCACVFSPFSPGVNVRSSLWAVPSPSPRSGSGRYPPGRRPRPAYSPCRN